MQGTLQWASAERKPIQISNLALLEYYKATSNCRSWRESLFSHCDTLPTVLLYLCLNFSWPHHPIHGSALCIMYSDTNQRARLLVGTLPVDLFISIICICTVDHAKIRNELVLFGAFFFPLVPVTTLTSQKACQFVEPLCSPQQPSSIKQLCQAVWKVSAAPNIELQKWADEFAGSLVGESANPRQTSSWRSILACRLFSIWSVFPILDALPIYTVLLHYSSGSLLKGCRATNTRQHNRG